MISRPYLRTFWLMLISFILALPVLADETSALGAGDRLNITVYGQEDLTTRTDIAADGTISMPLLGRVEVAGMTPPAAARMIEGRLEQGGYLRRAHVNLLVEENRSNTISILGQVNSPGQVALTGPTSLTEALALAGGINKEGGERIVVIRPGNDGRQSRQEFRLDELLDSSAEATMPITLRRGDTLYVPRVDQFYVHGQVQRPGTYPLNRPLNVMQALSVSGGFGPAARTSGLVLYRKQPDGRVVQLDAKLNDPMRDGDVLFVKESLF
ncbi:polysaccharide biosynthesis/export family protein [uncultured Marinobacter sp.]|uniref:polysaccharide biosynthesis/export family protein n=1 Tax=uncultured Marinobacter sp. TaxID=187379 RepID=UPI0030D7C45F